MSKKVFYMKRIVIMEHDSSESKIGFAGEEEPRFVFPTLYGRAKLSFPPPLKEYYDPDEALQHETNIKIDRPIENGIIDDWVTMVRIWDFCFDTKLKIDRKLHPVLIIIHPNNPRKIRVKIAAIMFETFEIAALCIKDTSYLINHARESKSQVKINSAWVAGSLYASSEENVKNFITLDAYDERGPEIIP